MPSRSLSQKSFADPEFVCPSALEEGRAAWLLGRFGSAIFPEWLLKGWRGEGVRGRKAWPARVLACLWVLRWTEEGMSRLGSVNRARTDLQWRAAMGLRCDLDPPSERTMRDFEKFLQQRHPDGDVPRYLLIHEHIVRLCIRHEITTADAIWGTDSTPMWCYGAVLDTVRLLGDGLRQLGRRWARATRCSLEEVADTWELPLLLAKSTKGSFCVDWRDRDVRAEVVDTLAGDVVRIVSWIRRRLPEARHSFRKGLLRDCRNLLRVLTDDLEADERGRLVVARRVARDRLVSITDPQARHGRKSRRRLFNGFKIHVLGDLVSGVIASVAVTAGNRHDSAPTHRLVRRAQEIGADIVQVIADTAYGGARTRHEIRRTLGVDLLTPPPPVSPPKGARFAKSDFSIDFRAGTSTCPAGVTTADSSEACHSEYDDLPTRRYKWAPEDCQACPLRAQCLSTRQKRRSLLLHPWEEELRRLRTAWLDPETARQYRRRAEFERLVHRVTRHGGRQARAWGLRAANLQAHAIVAGSNLALLAKKLATEEETASTLSAAA